jgi:hypothetical protein
MNEYDDLAGLEDVFGPLRSAARPAELSQESAMVDLMVTAHRTPEEKHMFRSRSARIATLVAVGVLGFGGMAAAEDPVEDLFEAFVASTDETGIDETGTDETGTDETGTDEPGTGTIEDAPAVEEVPLEDLDEAVFDETFCIEGGNHGKTVSAVARFLARGDFGSFFDEYPGDLTVKKAAQSSCGKPDKGGDDPVLDEPEAAEPVVEEPAVAESTPEESAVDEPEVQELEVEETEKPVVKAERPGKGADGPSIANERSNGKSNGNGNGNGKRGG